MFSESRLLAKSLLKKENSNGLKLDLWGTPDVEIYLLDWWLL